MVCFTCVRSVGKSYQTYSASWVSLQFLLVPIFQPNLITIISQLIFLPLIPGTEILLLNPLMSFSCLANKMEIFKPNILGLPPLAPVNFLVWYQILTFIFHALLKVYFIYIISFMLILLTILNYSLFLSWGPDALSASRTPLLYPSSNGSKYLKF